jgi:ribosomal protein L7/L12
MAKSRTALQTKYDGVIDDIFTIADGLLTAKQHNLNIETLVHLLIDDAIDMGVDEDAADYALAAVRLIDAYKLVIATRTTDSTESRVDDYAVVLEKIGPNKINVIKTIRELTNISLKSAKELVERVTEDTGAGVRYGMPRAEAEAWVRKFAEVGATAVVI